MAWIESHTVLGRHRKVILTASALGIEPVQLVGHLTVFWHAVLEQQEDGDLSDWSLLTIESLACWKGESLKFVQALQQHGWLDGHLVHDWLDYTGKYLITKYSSGNPERLKEIWAKYGYKYGKGQGKYSKQKATKKRVVSDQKATLPNLTLPNPSEPNLTNLTKPPDEFDVFWKAYPKKIGKKAALQAWKKAVGRPALAELLQSIEKQKKSEQWSKDNGQFIPHPVTWLNQGRWDDEVKIGAANGQPLQAKIPPMPGPEDPIGRNLWTMAYGSVRR